MRLDLRRIDDRVQFIRDSLTILRELASFTEAEFVADKYKFYTAVHLLQTCIEAMLDVFSHIVARLHQGAPSNDRELLEVAFKKGLTNEDHFGRFLKMNKFRNKVVHGYLDVDTKKVYEMLQTNLGDFDVFFDDLNRIIEKEKANNGNAKQKKSNSKKRNTHA